MDAADGLGAGPAEFVAAVTSSCPNHVTRPISRTRVVTFRAACCSCPLRVRCTRDKTGRSLTLHPHDALLRQARRDWATRDDLRATYRRHQPMVERGIAWLIGPKGRCANCATTAWPPTTGGCAPGMAALNLRRLINLGLAATPTGWATD
jgi:Transposase DDE domain